MDYNYVYCKLGKLFNEKSYVNNSNFKKRKNVC